MSDDARRAAPGPMDPDEGARRLMEVFDLVGPLYHKVFRKVEQETPVDGVSVGVRAVLDLLHRHGPLTVPRMSRAQALSRQFVQRMVNDAVALGYAESRPNPAHRRSPLIALTPAGAEAVAAVTAHERTLLRQVGGDLTHQEVDACLKVLGRMLDLFADVDMDGAAPAAPTRRRGDGVTP
ncbi:MarR family winged helix-turn-helix transcriptional regulator [Streptomyces abyssomicinicus]|uniref:MarR family winged helix-turn-helix transcriptional regulator n=1 Tax=Streptomyces abyssomicinicus TaxID=574929 RepID=UPI0012505758|nr:MarR family winged helix-turn-helix transcriptional regulator [Streptomyces abyssomicinicus]